MCSGSGLATVRPYVSGSTLLGFKEKNGFITNLVVDFSTDLLSVIPEEENSERSKRERRCV